MIMIPEMYVNIDKYGEYNVKCNKKASWIFKRFIIDQNGEMLIKGTVDLKNTKEIEDFLLNLTNEQRLEHVKNLYKSINATEKFNL